MKAGQLTDNFMPSEIARLILGYLKQTNCMTTWETFLSESPHLHEYKQLFNEGKEYPTNFNGKSLLDILQTYYTSSLKNLDSINSSIVERLENSISQLKNFASSESTNPRSTKQLSIGCISRQTTLQCVRTHSNIADTPSQKTQQNRNEARSNEHNASNLNSCSQISDKNLRIDTQMEVEERSPNAWNESSSQILHISPVSSSSFITGNSSGVQPNHIHSNNNANANYINHCINDKEIELRTKSDHPKNTSKQHANLRNSTPSSDDVSLVRVSVHLDPEMTENCTEFYEKRNCNGFSKQLSCSSSHSVHMCHQTTSQSTATSTRESVSSHCENGNVFVTQCHQQTCPCVTSSGIGHNCNFSTHLPSESLKQTSNCYTNNNGLNLPANQNRNTVVLPSTQMSSLPNLPRNSVPFPCTKQNNRTNSLPRIHVENMNATSNNSFDCISRVNLTSALNQEVRSCTVGHLNFLTPTSANEHSPSALFSQQRNLLPSLTTPVKDMMDEEDFYRSPKRKSLIPRRRLLSSFSPTVSVISEGENSRKDSGIVSEELNHPKEDVIDLGNLMEELIKFPPLVEKIAENINIVVGNDHNQLVDTSKMLTDSEASLSSQESHVPDALIKDILQRMESDPLFEEILSHLCEKVDSRDSFENDIPQVNDNQRSVEEPENIESPKENPQFNSSIILSNPNETLIEGNTSTVTQPFQNISKENMSRENNNNQNCDSNIPQASATSSALQDSTLIINTEPEVTSSIGVSLSSTVVSHVQTVKNGSSNVTLANNYVVQPATMTPIKINVPDFQLLTVSPTGHLFGMQTLLSFEQKRAPERVQPIMPKLTDGSSTLPGANSTCILQHGKERMPNGKRTKRQRCLRSKLQKISENTSIDQLKANKICNNLQSNGTKNKLPQENAALLSPTRRVVGSQERADKTSPQLKSLVTSAQALAGRSNRASKAHGRVLDFGQQNNVANSTTGCVSNTNSNNLVIQAEIPPDVILTSENQTTEDFQMGYFNETGELIIYFHNPEALNESVVTIPYNSEITTPAVVTYSMSTQNSEMPIAESANCVSVTNDSEIAETLVSLYSSGCNSNKRSQSKPVKQTEPNSVKRNFRTILPKKSPKPKQNKSQDKLLQGMDVDKFLSRVHDGE